MSVTRLTIVSCDGCGFAWDDSHQTVKQIRADRRSEGWVQRESKDYCSVCKKKYRKTKTATED